MSIKNLFSNKPTTMQSANSASSGIESPDFLEALRREREEIVPPIDFLSASNFVRFGSAKEYYAESIKRVYNSYPYDGSQKEKVEYNLSSSYLDRYIFNYKYPKHVGYANFSSDSYIQINRGYNQATVPSSNRLSKLFEDSDPYHSAEDRKKQSFVFNLDDGVTIEWWMKKSSFDTTQETFFELSSSNIKMDLVLTGTTEPVKFYGSSSAEISLSSISDSGFESSDLADNSWTHYAVSISNTVTNTIVDFYRNGVHKKENSFTKIATPTGNITGFLASGSYGLLSASVDEFRYWNKKQTSESIYNNYISGINGGANTDEYRKEISVYFKFNEGKTGDQDTDRIVLDYSGRLSNGYWQDYSGSNRQSGSYTSSEVADPIVRSSHPLVQSLLTEMETSGSVYDTNSKMQLYDLIPAWIRDEDEENGEELKHIIQIIASYFDTLYAQIEFLPSLKDKHYYQDDEKPMPFVRRILEDKGLLVSDILINRTIVEYFQKKDLNGIQYEKDLEILKNRIYHNIYNNLEYIYKTKGTEKSYRNMLRCFGIDDELVKLNLYTDNAKQYLVDKTKHTSQKTKHIDFDDPENFSATIYQENNISGSTSQNLEKNNAITLEVETMIPKKLDQSDPNFYNTSFVSSSVFGLDAIDLSTNTYVSTPNLNNFQVYLVRDSADSDRAKWVVEQTNHNSGTSAVVASSEFYEEIYNNQRWNIAVKIYPEGYPFAGSFSTTTNPNYVLEFYGVTHNFDEILHEFTTTASLNYTNGTSILSAHKKVYVGARRTNWSGSILAQSDVKVAACSLYYDKLDAVSIKQHNLDPSNYGHNRVFGNPTPFLNSAENVHLPAQHTLALHWDFQTVTGSDSSGQFVVEDFSSASVNGRYDWLGNIVVQEHKGVGFGFPASNTGVVKNEFIFASKKELPEISFTSDNVTIVGDENIYLYEDEDVSDNIFAFEKSMYQVVSQEMLNMFTTMIEYSNMFAKPVDRYRFNYKRLSHARKLFFEKTSTNLDLDRFTEYYKWIDSSISFFLEQLHPSNAKFNKGISETIESHILERPKYQHLLSNIEEQKTIKEQPARGINELTYNWKSGHAPVPGEAAYTNDNLNCLWRKEREKRTGTNATEREQLKTVISSDTYVEEIPFFGTNAGTVYQGSTYGLRRFSRPHKLSVKEQKTIHGGINYERAKDRDLLKSVIPRHGTKNYLGVPTDVVVLGVGPGQGLLDNQACEERNQNPTYREKYGTIAIVGKYSNFDGSSPISGSGITTVTQEYAYNLKGQRIFPFNMVSGNISTGYNAVISSSYFKDVYLTNLHSDTTDSTNEIPMQGPFTKTWVGGRQSRHIAVNRGSDDESSRPEEWRMLIGDHPDSADQDGAMGLTGPDYGGPYPDPTRQSAVHYRDGRAKRPLNIQNVQTTGGIKGNYDEKYEVVSIVGRKENNLKFREFEPTHNFLPTELGNALPETTNLLTLATIAPSSSGNVWGIGESNRINSFSNILRPGVLASGSFTVTGATLYKAAYTGSLNIQSIPFQGLNQTYHFQVSGATDYYEIYSGSFDVQPVPHAGTHQTYYFQATGATNNRIEDIYTGSFEYDSPPRMPKNQTYYFKVTGSTHNETVYTGSFDVQQPPLAPEHSVVSFEVGNVFKTGSTMIINTGDHGNKRIEVSSTTGKNFNTSDPVDIKVTNHLGRAKAFKGTISGTGWAESNNNTSGVSAGSDATVAFWFRWYGNYSSLYLRDSSGNFLMNWDVSNHPGDEIILRFYDTTGVYDDITFTPSPVLSVGNWYHIIISIPHDDYSSTGGPRVYVNNSEATRSSYGWAGLGDTRDFEQFALRIQGGGGESFVDFTVIDKVLSSGERTELYNGGVPGDIPSMSFSSDITKYFRLGDEYYFAAYGIGDTLGGNISIPPTIGTGDLYFTSYQADFQFIDSPSFTSQTDTQTWDTLKTSLNSVFTGWTAEYSSENLTDKARFWLRKDTADATSVTTSITNQDPLSLGGADTFISATSDAGQAAATSNLEDQDAISVSGSTFTVFHTTSGSAATDLIVGSSYRKALRIAAEPAALYHESYTNLTSTHMAVSFWMKIDDVNSSSNRVWEFDRTTTSTTSNHSYAYTYLDDFVVYLYPQGSGQRKITVNGIYTSDDIGVWKHYVITWHRTDFADTTTDTKIYINGVSQTLTIGSSITNVGTPTALQYIAIGSDDGSSNDPQNRGLQDFAIWNTQLTQEDANILYNSGSWLNIHSHPSASYVWDWWMLGEESNIGQTSGSALGDGTPVTSIAPTIGNHSLTISDNTNVFVTDGTLSSSKSSSDWYTYVASQIESNTNYSASNSSNTINLHQTSSAVITDSLSNSNNTFTNEASFGLHVNNYISGAVANHQIQIEDEVFIVSTSSSPSTFASSSGGISINSTGPEFWNYLSGAIEQYLPEYTASYYVYDNEAQFFVRNGTAGNEANDTLTATGTTFTNTGKVLGGSSNNVPVVIQDGDTISISGSAFTVRYTTKGTAATDFIAGGTYRKATHFKETATHGSLYLSGSYTNPTSDNISLSFWIRADDVDNEHGYLIDFKDSTPSADHLVVYRDEDDLKLYLNGAGGTKTHTYSSCLVANRWQHYTININTLNVASAPILYKNGQAVSSTSAGSGTGALRDLQTVFIGDYNLSHVAYEWRGSVQDMVVWNTGLDSQDAAILYNSGSWLDTHSHPSASYIWDWWSLDGYVDGHTSGSSLTANGISSIAPTIGRHTLVPGPDAGANVFTTDGIYMTANPNWISTELIGKIESQTNYSASLDGGGIRINLHQTSSVPISDSLNLTGITFSNKNVFGFDRTEITYISGAVFNNQLKIEDEIFIVSTSSSPSTWSSGSGGISVNSTGSEFWNYLSGAIEQYLPQYTASYYVHDNEAQFFVRNGESGSQPNDNFDTYSGATWNGAGLVLGSDMSASSNLTDGDTLDLDGDTFNLRYTTSGSAATDFMVGTEYRKAFNWKATDATNKISLKNINYTNPTSDNVSFSFWIRFDDTSNNGYILDANGVIIDAQGSNIRMRLQDASSDNSSYNISRPSVGQWHHYTITIDTTNVDTTPVVYKNGQSVTVSVGALDGSGAARDLDAIYIGDRNTTSADYELQGSLQDFVIWNTGLNSEDATVLYNSGSWLDIHSHPSASYIWDWWEFSGSVSGSAISSIDNNITYVSPTVGRHTLVYDDDTSGNVFVTDGIVDDKKASSAFKTHVADVIRSQTVFSASVSSVLLEVTAAVDIHSTGSFSTPGTTFTSLSGIEFVKYGNYYSGSVGLDQIEFEGKTFIVSGSTTPTDPYTIDGNNVYVYSHQDSDTTWWNNLTGAIEATLPAYTASYFQSGTMGHFFARNASTGSNAYTTITETGDSFFELHMVTGSNTSGSSNLADQDTLSIVDNTGTHTITVGHTTYGTGNTINTGTSYRKALHFKKTPSLNEVHLKNTSYTNPTLSNISISFWVRFDDASNNGYIFESSGVVVEAVNASIIKISLIDGSSNSSTYTISRPSVKQWHHYTIVINKTNVDAAPVVYKNGQSITVTSDATAGTGAIANLTSVYIGDKSSADADFELQGSLQDFVIWNTGLNSEDSTILYNSGSWLDIHSHPSASSIWDWWMFGGEEEFASSASGSSLQAPNVPSIAPTVGRHTLFRGTNADLGVFVTDGIHETNKLNLDFWNEVTQSINDNTEFDQSYTNTSSDTLYELTASTVITGSMMLQETVLSAIPAGTNSASFGRTGTTFSVRGINRGPEVLNRQRYQNAGASHLEYVYIAPNFEETTGSYFIIDNVNAGGNSDMLYTTQSSGIVREDSLQYVANLYPPFTASFNSPTNYYKIRSSASTNQEFWNVLKSAIEYAYPKYTINTASAGNTCVFDLTGSIESTFIMTDTDHINNRVVSGGKKKYSISSPRTSTETTSYLKNEAVTNYGTSGAISISFWLKSEIRSVTYDRYILDSYDNADNNAMYLKLNGSQDLYFGVYDDDNQLSEWIFNIRALFTDNSLRFRGLHIIITWDGNFSSNPEIYVNGILGSSYSSIGGYSYQFNRTIGSSLGSGTDRVQIQKLYLLNSATSDSNNELIGSLNDFGIWETELNSTDARIIYNNGSYFDIENSVSASSIIDYWELGEEAVFADLVPNDPITASVVIPAHSTRGNNDLTTGGGLKLSVGFNNTGSNDTYYSTSGISGGLDQVIETGLINVVQREDDNITGSTRQKTIIASRFSAPGGVEVQTYGYLDAYAHEYSVHNSLNFRNQPVKNNSGESGTIRVNSHASRREGLNTLYKRHTGKFGYDSTYGSVSSSSYDGEPSFHKVHRNLYTKPIVNSKALRLGATSTGLASMSSTVDTTIYGTTGSISLSFWMKLDRTDGNTTHIYSAMDTDGDISQRLYYKSGYLFWLFYREDGSSNTEIGSFSLLLVKNQFKLNNLLEWNHIAVAWDGLDNGAGRLYLNGTLHHTDSTFNAPYAAFAVPDVKNSSRAPASIHLYDLGNASSFYELEGALQEFIIWDKEIDATDVSEIYNEGNYFNAVNATSNSSILEYWGLGLGEAFDPFDYGSTIPSGFTIKSLHGISGVNLTTNVPYQVVPGFYRTSDANKPTRKDNYFIQSTLPSSDYNYSWVTSSLGNNYNVRSGTQKVFGYWPRNGLLSSSSGVDSAITFPTASNIQGS